MLPCLNSRVMNDFSSLITTVTRIYGKKKKSHFPLQHRLNDKSEYYRKVPKFSDARKLCCNHPKVDTTGPNLRVIHHKDANGKANTEDLDQIAPREAV